MKVRLILTGMIAGLLLPLAAANAGPSEPIWPEPVPPAPGSTGSTAASASAPVQLSPPAQSANSAVRTQ